MRLLLDTHIVLWAMLDPSRLANDVRAALSDRKNAIFVSAISTWELTIKYASGKLSMPVAPEDLFPREIAAAGFAVLAIEVRHTFAAGNLPMHHRDPFDRMLVAQAILENMQLVTTDAKIAAYDVPLFRV